VSSVAWFSGRFPIQPARGERRGSFPFTETRPRRLWFPGRDLFRSAAKDGLPSGEGRAGDRRPPFDSAPPVRPVP
jgi:hypothetical protein